MTSLLSPFLPFDRGGRRGGGEAWDPSLHLIAATRDTIICQFAVSVSVSESVENTRRCSNEEMKKKSSKNVRGATRKRRKVKG